MKKYNQWGGNMTREEFNLYMNKKFDEMIDRLCPPKNEDKENNKKEQ